MKEIEEDIEPIIDCENTNCEECGVKEWCNVYQDELHNKFWGDDEDDEYDYEYDEQCEREMEELYERAERCTCGAWVITVDTYEVIHIADCICGAEDY